MPQLMSDENPPGGAGASSIELYSGAGDDLAHVDELDALRRRLDEQGSVLRTVQSQVGQLAESIAAMVAAGRRRERTLNLNSFVAYVLFTVLLGGGALLLYRTRVDELVEARDRAVGERTALGNRAKELQEELAARDVAGQRALAYWQLLQEGKRNEAIARYAELSQDHLTPTERAVFADSEKSARGEVVDAGYLAGLDAYRAGQHDKAASELKRALAYEEEGPRAAQMRYYLGVSLVKLGDAEGSVRELEKALAGRVEQGGAVDARFWLGVAYEKLGQYEQARTQLDKFASAEPMNPLSVAARRRSAALARRASPTN
jgi:tetratricopeptide (TPR) repeat protein